MAHLSGEQKWAQLKDYIRKRINIKEELEFKGISLSEVFTEMARLDDELEKGYQLVLKSVGVQKINTIKAIRNSTGIGLVESRRVVDGPLPFTLHHLFRTLDEALATANQMRLDGDGLDVEIVEAK